MCLFRLRFKMGVNGLLNLLKLIQNSIHVRNFSHKAAGIGANYLGHRSRYFDVEYRISKIFLKYCA